MKFLMHPYVRQRTRGDAKSNSLPRRLFPTKLNILKFKQLLGIPRHPHIINPFKEDHYDSPFHR